MDINSEDTATEDLTTENAVTENVNDVIPRLFYIGKRRQYKIEERYKLAKLVDKFKMEFDEYMKNPKKEQNTKTKKWHVVRPTDGYYSKAIRLFYSDIKDLLSSNKRFRQAYDVALRAYKTLQIGGFEKLELNYPLKNKFRLEGGGCHVKAPGLRAELFEWFIDIR